MPEPLLQRCEDDQAKQSSFCPPGWIPLITELDQKIAEMSLHYTILQVKEKLGTLRYYVRLPREGDNSHHMKIYDLIEDYENKSAQICDQCGEEGSSIKLDMGIIATRCPKHSYKIFYEDIND